MPDPVEIGLCTGKDCRRSEGFRTVKRELARGCVLVELPCLDVCHGAVVVIEPRSSKSIVLERVGTRALASEIVDHVVNGDEVSGPLRKRRLTGAKRTKARRRIERAM